MATRSTASPSAKIQIGTEGQRVRNIWSREILSRVPDEQSISKISGRTRAIDSRAADELIVRTTCNPQRWPAAISSVTYSRSGSTIRIRCSGLLSRIAPDRDSKRDERSFPPWRIPSKSWPSKAICWRKFWISVGVVRDEICSHWPNALTFGNASEKQTPPIAPTSWIQSRWTCDRNSWSLKFRWSAWLKWSNAAIRCKNRPDCFSQNCVIVPSRFPSCFATTAIESGLEEILTSGASFNAGLSR